MSSYIELPSFNPVIIDLPGPLSLTWYGTMYLCGFLSVYLFVNYQIRKRNVIINQDLISNVMGLGFLGVLLGGRLGFVFFVAPKYYLDNPGLIIRVWEGGMYFFGGLIVAMLLPLITLRKANVNYFDLCDLIVIPAPLALAFGRLGNFINGEFWGKVSRVPWAMIFPTVPDSARFDPADSEIAQWISDAGIGIPSSGLVNLPRHPVQLYELVLEGIILFFILFLFRNIGRPKPRGSLTSLFIGLYGIMRFWIEFYRHPVSHSALVFDSSWLTVSMLLSIPMILLGVAGLWFSYRKNIPNAIYSEDFNRKRRDSSEASSSAAKKD